MSLEHKAYRDGTLEGSIVIVNYPNPNPSVPAPGFEDGFSMSWQISQRILDVFMVLLWTFILLNILLNSQPTNSSSLSPVKLVLRKKKTRRQPKLWTCHCDTALSPPSPPWWSPSLKQRTGSSQINWLRVGEMQLVICDYLAAGLFLIISKLDEVIMISMYK